MQPITFLCAHLMKEMKGIAQQDWMDFPIKILLMYGNVLDLNLPRLADVVPCMYVCMCMCPYACGMTEMYGAITQPIHGGFALQSHFTHSAPLIWKPKPDYHHHSLISSHSLSFIV